MELDNLINQNITFPNESIFSNGKSNVLILVKDTNDCSACSMHISDWYVYQLDLEDQNLDINIIYVLKENIRLPNEVDSLISVYGLHKYYGYEKLLEKNPCLKHTTYSTFLLSPENQIQIVGNPIEIPDLWNLYRKYLKNNP